ncbi:ATP-binding protein [Sulfurimonas sp.]|uniref:AAA family ATPase n=1 Tax=Sulfurimonas sp. TaxID=2022749 RepID=UPI0019F5607E|nr:ATP-binding protein [Sulfurimonas sp.]MBE0514042.1 ATP-binding protein [Sulfurimonas sp.]
MFQSGSPVKGKDFIDRKKHLPLFKSYLDNNQHIMIKAPRRFGKTSLIKHMFDYEKGYDFIYIDIRLHHSLDSLSKQIVDSAYSFVKIENFIRQTKNSLLKLLKSIKTISIPDMAEVTIDLVSKESDPIELFIHSLNVVDSIATSKGANIKVIFDEFQDITKLYDKNILEVLRSVAQHHENITYVFLGSIESIMTEIFESKASPFFHFASVIKLDGLDADELFDYTKTEFDKQGIVYDAELLRSTITFLEGHPEYSAKVLQTLYINAMLEKKPIDYSSALEAISFRVIENRAYLDELIAKLKSKKHHFEVVYEMANNLSHDVDSATLYNTRVSLENMGLIAKLQKGEYKIVDIFLKILLQQHDDKMVALEGRLDIGLEYDYEK